MAWALVAATTARLAVGFGVLLVIVGVITQFSVGSFLLFVLFITHALVETTLTGTVDPPYLMAVIIIGAVAATHPAPQAPVRWTRWRRLGATG